MRQDVAFGRLELRSLANKRKSRAVAQAITEAIDAGHLGPYERLPSERALAEQFGVGRGAVREALSALQLSGVIQIRTGEGSFVNPVGLGEGTIRTLHILDQNKSPLELWDARCALEVTLVRMALKAATATDIKAAEDALVRMRSAAEHVRLEDYLDANNAFHAALMRPIENTILLDFMLELIEATGQLMTRETVRRYLEENMSDSVRKHVGIFEAFRTRDPARLEAAIVHHFNELIDFYLKE